MTFQLLAHWARASLPLEVGDTEGINALVALKAAGLVSAEIPPVVRSLNGLRYDGAAFVHAVTGQGLAVLKQRSKPGQKQR